ncbi:MAG: SOS response-associated peptidase family protein [Verrucomicrobiales bacterium]|nr:SOS response-associated peptidase family protein [Verrucomicrobiales bacterium]
MCNLYDIGRALRHRSRDDWEEALSRALKDSRKAFGIRKTDPGLVLILPRENASIQVETMRWGFARDFNPAINNARSDKLGGMWSNAWEHRQRCLIPLATFYEWTGPPGSKQTYAFEPDPGVNLLWAAGLWEPAPSSSSFTMPTFSMLTTAAKGVIAPVHDRMPVLLQPQDFDEFLSAPDPGHLLDRENVSVTHFRCENPLKQNSRHEGAVRQTMLPGFD